MPNPSKDHRLIRVHAEKRDMLATAILSLPDSERMVFTLYYYGGVTTEQLELLLGETGASISQIHTSALSHLHDRLAALWSRTPETSELPNLSNGGSSGGLTVSGLSLERWLRYGPIQEIKIKVWRNDEAEDWSIEINGLRHEHVSSEILENLVEAALIVAEKWLMEPTTRRQ